MKRAKLTPLDLGKQTFAYSKLPPTSGNTEDAEWRTRPVYVPPVAKSLRPGAEDAFKLPSRGGDVSLNT